jgi:predicted nuclease with TOPRIM domain
MLAVRNQDDMSAQILAELVNLKTYVGERFDRVEGRLDRVEGRLDRVEGRLTSVEVRVTSLEGAVRGLEWEFDQFRRGRRRR